MSYRTFHVSHSRDAGFILHLTKRSQFRDFIVSCAEALCVVTRHRFCNQIVTPPIIWSDKKEVILDQVSIDREAADALAGMEDAWTYLDE